MITFPVEMMLLQHDVSFVFARCNGCIIRGGGRNCALFKCGEPSVSLQRKGEHMDKRSPELEAIFGKSPEEFAREYAEKNQKKPSCKPKNKKSKQQRLSYTGLLKEFYTYVLRDPRNGEIFYVGKGAGDRIQQHARDSEKHSDTLKLQRINDIKQDGLNHDELVVGRFDTFEEAFAVESTLIHWVYGFNSLTNDQSGHNCDFIRPKDNLNHLPGIDVPDVTYCEKERDKRERYRVEEFLEDIKITLSIKYPELEFRMDKTTSEKHTYLYAYFKDVKLALTTHHNGQRSVTITLECLQNNKYYKGKILEIAENKKTNFEAKKYGGYARIPPAGTITGLENILNKFEQTYNELKIHYNE